MTDPQLALIAQIINGLCVHADAIVPYSYWGFNVGKCRFCGAIGEPKSGEIVWTHTDMCVLVLNEELKRSMSVEKEEPSP